ncbi:MAG: hemolysin III family protein [Verrucomicrobiales bacterium]|nr:hemolysin III family protein [Verrucomicrobiales bacterium]
MTTRETKSEELANSISHGFGVLFSIGALMVMLFRATPHSIWHIAGVGIFGVCLILLYLSSTIYHTVTSDVWKPVWQIIDHCFIFVLIAGSYMPWVLVNLRGPWGWTLLGVVWGLAILGIILKAFFMPRFKILGVAIYILMGWLICIAAGPLLQNVSLPGLIWLTAGGLSYTGGVIFFLQKNMKYSHAIWHGFVLLGSFCHVVAVLVAVIPHS